MSDLDPVLAGSKVISAVIALSLADVEPPLSLPQLRALGIVGSLGPMNLSAVAEGLAVNPSNASRTCDQLVANGLLDRREDAEDRRSVALTLTRKGQRVLDRLTTHRRAVLEQVMEEMSVEEQKCLSMSMGALARAADRLSDRGQLLSDGDGHLLRWMA